MRTAKSLMVILLTLFSVVVVGVVSIVTSAVTRAAATGLIVPGTGTPDADKVTNFKTNAQKYYMGATACPSSDATCELVGVPYPASLWPLVGGLSGAKYGDSVDDGVAQLNSQIFLALQASTDPVVVFGFSQGSNVASFELENLRYLDQATKDRLSFVFTGNTQRPNGGIWTRLGPLGHIPILDIDLGKPTPNDIGIKLMDIVYEYDAVGDAPNYLFNVLTIMNSLCGLAYIHPTYIAPNGNTKPDVLPDEYTEAELAAQLDPAQHPENFRYFGPDATYVIVPTKTLPIMRPGLELAASLGLTPVVKPIIDLISPVFRVLIDLGYNRSINPGEYTPFKLFPIINPFTLTGDLVDAAFEGVNNAVNGLASTSAPAATVAPSTAAPKPASPTRKTPPSSRSIATDSPPAATTTSATTDAEEAAVPDHPRNERIKPGNLFRPGSSTPAHESHDESSDESSAETTTPTASDPDEIQAPGRVITESPSASTASSPEDAPTTTGNSPTGTTTSSAEAAAA